MSLPPGALIKVPKVDNTLGAMLVGGFVAMALWGITCVQTYTFFLQKTRDSPLFKLSIAFLWALDTFDSALVGHFLYYYLVSNYLDPAAFESPVWSVIIHVTNTSISNFLIRTMFARRFYALSGRNVPFTILIMILSATDLTVGLVITGKAFTTVKSFADLSHLSTLLYLNFAAGLGSDLAVALGLSTILLLSKTGFRRTDSLIKTLMMYTVNTGAIVAIDAALGMITYVVMPHNLIFLAFYLLLSKLYLNSYLAMLNARGDLRDKSEDPVSIHLSHLSATQDFDSGAQQTFPSAIEKGHLGAVAIAIRTKVEKQVDNSSATSSIVDSPY